jgi:hypothetical protein
MAWEAIRKNGGDQDLPDIICFEDAQVNWPYFRSKLVSAVNAGIYSLSHVEVLDLPKDELNVRPLARLALEDRLIYDACVLAMAPTIDAAIPNNVYSYRWSKYKQALYSPSGRWIRMQRRGRRFNLKNQQMLLLRTDVTSFYEYVDVEILLSDLHKLDVPPWSLELLENFLSQFNHETHAWGLPQGPDSSGILANFYLLPVDKYFQRVGLTHLRYSDDIMVFGQDWSELRKALLRVNHMFRARHLCLSATKTKIIPANKVVDEFEDSSKDAVRYNIDIALPTAPADLQSYFAQVISSKPLSVRNLRFALNQMRRIEDDTAVHWLLDNMGRLPHVAREAIRYLRAFRERRHDIDAGLAEMLYTGCFSWYPSVERRIINYLVLENVDSPKALDACWSIIQDQNKGIVREFAARYVGKFSELGDVAQLKELFEREANEAVKRALLIGLYESGVCPGSLLASLSKSSGHLGMTARYLLSSPKRLPCPSMEVTW